jgi:hypothetical protein
MLFNAWPTSTPTGWSNPKGRMDELQILLALPLRGVSGHRYFLVERETFEASQFVLGVH